MMTIDCSYGYNWVMMIRWYWGIWLETVGLTCTVQMTSMSFFLFFFFMCLTGCLRSMTWVCLDRVSKSFSNDQAITFCLILVYVAGMIRSIGEVALCFSDLICPSPLSFWQLDLISDQLFKSGAPVLMFFGQYHYSETLIFTGVHSCYFQTSNNTKWMCKERIKIYCLSFCQQAVLSYNLRMLLFFISKYFIVQSPFLFASGWLVNAPSVT